MKYFQQKSLKEFHGDFLMEHLRAPIELLDESLEKLVVDFWC